MVFGLSSTGLSSNVPSRGKLDLRSLPILCFHIETSNTNSPIRRPYSFIFISLFLRSSVFVSRFKTSSDLSSFISVFQFSSVSGRKCTRSDMCEYPSHPSQSIIDRHTVVISPCMNTSVTVSPLLEHTYSIYSIQCVPCSAFPSNQSIIVNR